MPNLTSDQSQSLVLRSTFSRPANQTPYTAGDVVGGVLLVPGVDRRNDVVTLTHVDVLYNVAALPSGMTGLRMHVYGDYPPSGLADNAPFNLTSLDRFSYAGYVDLGTPADFGDTLVSQATGLNLKVLTTSTYICVYLVTTTGFTPAADSETITLILNVS